MILDLTSIPCVLLTVAHNKSRHVKCKEWLDRYGFNRVEWVFGRETPHNHHQGAREMAANTLKKITVPCLWIEDDTTPTPIFQPTVEIPDYAQIFYLGGHASGRSTSMGMQFPAAERGSLPVRLKRNNKALYYSTGDPRFIRILSMHGGHAILWLDESTRKAFSETLAPDQRLNYDETFALNQWRYRVYGLREPYLYQQDQWNVEQSLYYCHPAPKRTILLTTCIFPSCQVTVSDPETRLAEVIAACWKWSDEQLVDSIIVVDTSGYRPDNLASLHAAKLREWLSLDLSAMGKEHGKGRCEAAAIRHAIDNSKQLGDSFFKCTGHLASDNFTAQASQITPDAAVVASDSDKFAFDSRFFYCTRNAFDTYLRNCEEEIGDSSPRTFIENVYNRATEKVRKRFDDPSLIIGRSSTGGKVYHRYFYPARIAKAKSFAARLLTSLCKTR